MSTDIKEIVKNENLATLSCAVELGARTLIDIAGNEISNVVGGEEVTLTYLQHALAARMKAALAPSTGGK